jgi:transcriptional regulator with XRE-family HTH domain
MPGFSKENSFSRATIGGRVREVRGALTYQAFADRLGVSPGFVNEIEHGRKKPSAEMLFALETEFGIDVNWLLRGGERDPRIAETPPRYGAPTVRPRPASPDIPLYPLGESDLTEPPLHTLRLPPAFSSPTILAVKISDDSMAPTLPLGALAGIDQHQRAPTDGVLHLVSIKQGGIWTTSVRRLYRVPGGIRLRAENERHGDVTIKRGEVKIRGRVVWIVRGAD